MSYGQRQASLSESDAKLIARLHELEAQGDIETLVEMARLYETVKALGRAGDALKHFLLWSGVVLSATYFAYNWIVDFVKKP